MDAKIFQAKVLITVKTYPKPSSNYDELVCTAGLLNGEKWIRIYPVAYRFLENSQKYPKYSWVNIDLIRNTKDFRPESYRPMKGLGDFQVVGKIGTANNWATRKGYVLRETFVSMKELIECSRSPNNTSLATVKPKEIINYKIIEVEREWKESWKNSYKQSSLFDIDTQSGDVRQRTPLQKIPYAYSYEYITEGDSTPRTAKIEDWEIGALYLNCLKRTEGDEDEANRMVKEKYFYEFIEKKDIHFFMGTTLSHHKGSPNPFFIIGVFYPPKSAQSMLF